MFPRTLPRITGAAKRTFASKSSMAECAWQGAKQKCLKEGGPSATHADGAATLAGVGFFAMVAAGGFAATRFRDASEKTEYDRLKELVARSPQLGGEPLPIPVFREGCLQWKLHQKFSMAKDNPYNSQEKPPVADFLKRMDTIPTNITKHVMPTEALKWEKDFYKGQTDKTFAWQFDGVFTQEQCRELIKMANEKKFTPALSGQGMMYPEGDPRKFDELIFDPKRRDTNIAMFDCPELAEWVFKALEHELQNAPVPDGWRLDHINSYVRMLLYCKSGQAHPVHFDAMCTYPKGKYLPPHPWSKARSLWTIFIYLSEVPAESGGATGFPVPKNELKDSDIRVHPKPGRVLVFSQNMWHTGEPLSDHVKYVIRSDIMAMPRESP